MSRMSQDKPDEPAHTPDTAFIAANVPLHYRQPASSPSGVAVKLKDIAPCLSSIQLAAFRKRHQEILQARAEHSVAIRSAQRMGAMLDEMEQKFRSLTSSYVEALGLPTDEGNRYRINLETGEVLREETTS